MPKVVGTVAPSEVPEKTTRTSFGVWSDLARQVIDAHQRGEVLVIIAQDRDEHKRMVNGMSERFRQAGYARRFVSVDEPDGGVRVYCQLADKPGQNGLVLAGPTKRPKRRANA